MKSDLTVKELKEYCESHQRCQTCKYVIECNNSPSSWSFEDEGEDSNERRKTQRTE